MRILRDLLNEPLTSPKILEALPREAPTPRTLIRECSSPGDWWVRPRVATSVEATMPLYGKTRMGCLLLHILQTAVCLALANSTCTGHRRTELHISRPPPKDQLPQIFKTRALAT